MACIQELIWSPPYKNPFPLCSQSILSRLKNLRSAWRQASPATHQSAMNLIEDLDADIKVLIALRKRCLKQLTMCEDSTADASTDTVCLFQKVDSILIQYLEDSWKERNFKLTNTDTDIQKHNYINQDCLTAEVLQLFVLDAPHQLRQGRKMDEIVEENSTVPEADCRANNAGELSVDKHYSLPRGQPLPASDDEHSPATPEQDPGFHIPTTDAITDAGRQSATGATNNTLQEIICTSNADENSSKGSGIEGEHCVLSAKPDVISTSSDALKATLSTSIHAQPVLASEEGTHLSIITPEAINDSGSRGTICTLHFFPQADQDSTATSEAKPNRFTKETEDVDDDVEQAATSLQEPSSCSATSDDYFSASSNGEHDFMIDTGSTKIRDYNSEIPESAIVVNGAASPMGANGSEISEVQRFPPGEETACTGGIQIYSSNRNTNGVLKFDENDVPEAPSRGTAGAKPEVKSKFAGNCSKELVEVEMTLRAKICEPESEEPYWHVMFALLNYSNFKVSVQKLEYWSVDKQEDVKSVHWGPGEMILREQPSFVCHSIKVPCSTPNVSPRLACSWQYSKLPEWIPTQGGKPKLEKGTFQKRLRNMVSFGNAEKKIKHDTGHVNWKPTKKRTA